MCCATCHWNGQKKIVPTTDYQVPTKTMKYFNQKSKVKIITYIHLMSYEYECFGSARTPVTKSCTSDPIASLICFIHGRSILRSLQRWVSMKSSISQLTFILFYSNCYRETIYDFSYTRERIMSSVSPSSSILWVTTTTSITACVQRIVPKTRLVYRRRPRVEACGTW